MRRFAGATSSARAKRGQTATLVCAALVASASVTRAQSAAPVTPVRLEWARGTGADLCPDARSIAEQVRGRLGHETLAEDARRTIEAYVTRSRGRWYATVVSRTDGTTMGRRTIDSGGESCDGIASAAVLAIVLAIRPDAPLALASPPNAAQTPPPSLPQVPTAAPPALDSERPAATRAVLAPVAQRAPAPTVRPFASAGGGAHYGLTPEFGAHVDGTIGLRATSPFEARLSFRYAFATRATAANAGITFEAALGAAHGCFSPMRQRIEANVCVGVWVGALVPAVRGVFGASPSPRLLVAPSVSVDAALRIAGPLRAWIAAEATVPATRDRFVLETTGSPSDDVPVFSVAYVIPALTIGARIDIE